MVREAPFAFERIHAEPVGRIVSPKGIKGLLKLAKSQAEAKRFLEEFKPDVVFGTGGYAAAPVLMAQKRRKGPFILHEQNAVAGRANRALGKHAAVVCLVFERAKADFKNARTTVTGMPVREEVLHCNLSPEQARATFGLSPDRWTVLVYGGSQGAQPLNEAVLAAAQFMPAGEVQWLHVAGDRHADGVRRSADHMGLNGNFQVRGFLNGPEVGVALRAASVAVTRCGAGTLSETLAWGLPSVMVPLPTAAANHQYFNALEIVEAGAGKLIKQGALSPGALAEAIQGWRDDSVEHERTSEAALRMFRPNATEAILGLLTEAAGGRNGLGTPKTNRKVS